MGQAEAVRRGLTVTRIIGNLFIRGTGAGADGEWTAGVGYNTREAEQGGVFPDPSNVITEGAFPWMWWLRGLQGFEFAAGAELLYTRYPMDIKSQRKLRDPGDTIRFMIDNDDGTEALVFALGFSILIKHP